jgi:hypothetical protein
VAHKFSELQAKMSPESLARSNKLFEEMKAKMTQDENFLSTFLQSKTIESAQHITPVAKPTYISRSNGLHINFSDGSSLKIRSYGSGHEDYHGLTLTYTDADGNETVEHWEEP